MFQLLTLYLLWITPARSRKQDSVEDLVEDIFPHHQFECDSKSEVYETEFSFLQGLGRGFVHAERHRIFFEYYFPASHWVGFSTADQSIQGQQDQCSACYFSHYYPLEATQNISNLYPLCIEECLEDTIFVATVNSDEENINQWNIIEFQIIAQESNILEQKMYRIPPPKEILQIWGSSYSPYRFNAHFETDIYTIGSAEYIHVRMWRKYDFAPNTDLDQYDESNEWKAFVYGPSAHDLYYPDSLCFISIGSFEGGEYPYDDDALQGLLPGFYIDTKHSANIHCYTLDDIKVDCGQDWSWLYVTKEQYMDQSEDTSNDDGYTSDITQDIATTTASTTTTTTTATTAAASESTASTLQPIHDDDCCSAISQISYDDINCLDISSSTSYIASLEQRWKGGECGRPDKLPTDVSQGVANSLQNDSGCDHLWAHFNQIYNICYEYSFTKNRMRIYNHFKAKGGYQCFDKHNDECIKKEIDNEYNFNYDEDGDYSTTNSKNEDKDKGNESELTEMEEDGGLTITSLGLLGVIIAALALYVLYWFCCSNSSKGYRQSSQFTYYYDDDIDTDDHTQRKYTQYEDGDNDKDSDWSEDEELDVINDDHNKMEIKKHKTKRKNKMNAKHNDGYDVNTNDTFEINVNA